METAHNTQRVANMSNNKIARGNIVFCEHQNKKKSLFQYQEEADAQARQENLKRPADKQLMPYYCKSCRGWHPDTVKLCTGKISGKEFGERTTCNGAGVVGGTGGAWAGAAIGSCICPGIGTAIGGFIGGIVGGMGASTGVGKLFRRN